MLFRSRGREKNLYSIYRKMQEKQLSFSEVLDIYAFRVIVNDIPSCYLALGALHSLYKPIPGKFKDYIAIPKSNGYQSLHTTLFGPYGTPIEVQIRTRDMHRVAESGVASHWMYKSGDASLDMARQRTHQWLQDILDIQAETGDAVEFFEHIKIDLFPDEVYVFTPKGKIMVLPQGATPVDFAYVVHTDIGHRCIAAKVNHALAPLRTQLKNGDTVEIITAAHARPNPSWLNFVVSGRARSAIRSSLKTLHHEEARSLGDRLLKQSIHSLTTQPFVVSDGVWMAYLKETGDRHGSAGEVLASIGAGKQQAMAVAARLLELSGTVLGEPARTGPLVIRGNEGSSIQYASCCTPLPGDPVVAVLTKGQGIVLHRKDCANAKRAEADRQLEAEWDIKSPRSFSVPVAVMTRDERGALAGIALGISEEGRFLLYLGILLHGVSYDFYYVTAYIYVDKKAPVHMRTAAQGLITLCCQGFGSLLGYRLGGVMMEKMFAYQEPVNGLTFNWAGMWGFGAVMIAVIAVMFMIFFRESDKEITAIEVRETALTQGEVK